MEYQWINEMIRTHLPEEIRSDLHWVFSYDLNNEVCDWLENLEDRIESSYRENYRYNLQCLEPAFARVKSKMEAMDEFRQRLIMLPEVRAYDCSERSEPMENASMWIGYLLRNSRGKYEVTFQTQFVPRFDFEARQVVIDEANTITLTNHSGLSIEVSDLGDDDEFIHVLMIRSKQKSGFFKVKRQVKECFNLFMSYSDKLYGMESLVLIETPEIKAIRKAHNDNDGAWRFEPYNDGNTRLVRYWRLMGCDITETEEGWPKATVYRPVQIYNK